MRIRVLRPPFNFRMLTEFVLISFIKPEVRKTLNINYYYFHLFQTEVHIMHTTNKKKKKKKKKKNRKR